LRFWDSAIFILLAADVFSNPYLLLLSFHSFQSVVVVVVVAVAVSYMLASLV